MVKFIRWQGLVAFIVLIAATTILLYFFAEDLVKSGIESSAESTFGAEVNVASVELAYSPLSLSVNGLQVTDKDMPTHNLFSFDRATAAVDVWQYFFGKIIIDELEVSGLAFTSERKKAGQVFLEDEEVEENSEESLSSQAKAMLPEMDMQLPDVKTLLNDSNLLTVKASEALKVSYKAERQKIKALKAQLPDKSKVKYYQNKVKMLGKSKVNTLDDIEKINAEYQALKAEFKADKALIRKAKEQLKASKSLLAKQAKELKGAPSKDWQVIEKKYQLETLDSEDFAHILFGEQARGYFQKAQAFYEIAATVMDNLGSEEEAEAVKSHATGRFIAFNEEAPLPPVLIKKAFFSMDLEQGEFLIKASELTHQHWIRGQDSLVNISSSSNGVLNLDTRFKLSATGKFIADGNWLIENRQINNASLTETKALSLALDKGKLTGEGTFTLVDGNILANNDFALHQASYQGNATTTITQLLVDTVKSLNNLTIDIEVDGKISKPSFSISSSLTGALTDAFKKQVSNKIDEFKVKVNKGLNAKLAESLKLGDSETAELLDLEALLTDTDKALTDLQNSDVVKQQKEKLKAKLKKKAEEKVKEKVKEKAKDKLNDKLKGKLGDLFG